MHENTREIIVASVLFGIFTLMLVIVFFLAFKKYLNNKVKLIAENEHIKAQFSEELLRSQLEIQEQTFNYISQEIHDNVGQILSLAKVQVNILEQKQQLDEVMLGMVKDNIGKAMRDLRDIAKSLNSEQIRTLSIHAIVENEVQRLNKSGFIYAAADILGLEKSMNEQKKLILFRIVQECLQNIIKHAKATSVCFDVCYQDSDVKIAIRDNGCGFDPLSAERGGLGLLNIKNRASVTGGSSLVESRPNYGTTVTITMPYE